MSHPVTNICRPLRLTAARKCVLMALADRANDDGSCWPSIAWLMEWTCFSKTPVLNALKWLGDGGLITITKSVGRSNGFQIELERIQKLCSEYVAADAATSAPEAPVPREHRYSKSTGTGAPKAPTSTPGVPVLLEDPCSKSTTTGAPGVPTGAPGVPDTSIDVNKTEERIKVGRPKAAQPDLDGMGSPAVIVMPVKGGKVHTVTRADVDGWRPAFPRSDIELELQRMRAWLMADPARLKTSTGVNRFIVAWLGRDQNSSRNSPTAVAPRAPHAHLGTDQRNYEEDFDGKPLT